jgi:hypothetical protein
MVFQWRLEVPQLLGLCGGFCPPGLDPVVVVPLLVLLDYKGFVLFVFFSLFYDRKIPSDVQEEEWCSSSGVGGSVERSSTF